MLSRILLGLVFILAALVGYVALQPSDYAVARSRVVQAAPAVVYEQVATFKNWRKWSPWDELDPDMERTYGGSETGEGATYAWKGNEDVGRGSMEITKAVPGESIEIALAFEEPFKSKSTTGFAFKEVAGGTEVTWDMKGTHDGLVSKAFSLLFNLDEMIGKDYDKGLATLASVAEKAAAEAAPAAEPVEPDEGNGSHGG